MKKTFILHGLFLLFAVITNAQQFRPPSVPLVAHDPYFSIWSPADNLYDRETVHWTGKNQPLHSIIRIDGVSYRLMGADPSYMEPLKQVKLDVLPTRTIYSFANKAIAVELTFTTPAIMYDLDMFSRPVTYITWDVKSTDGKEHDVQLYFDCSDDVVVNTVDQEVTWDRPDIQGLKVARLGSKDQPVLKKKGDDLRIDWGYAYLAVPESLKPQVLVSNSNELTRSFISSGSIPDDAVLRYPRRASDGWLVMGGSWNVGKVGSAGASSTIMLAYDDIKSVKYFDDQLSAWWKRNGMTIEQLLVQANADFEKIKTLCTQFDTELMNDLTIAGGSKYAAMCALVYRQSLAAQKLVADPNGMPLSFSKENFSNGCMATVDVMYPAAPIFYLFSPALVKATLQPIFSYASSPRWKFPFAPHDLGTYPHAVGQAYGGGEDGEDNQMPVEETGNILIMTAVLAKMEGNANYAEANWAVLEKWAEYLLSKGFDPENQLCTDDFAGHLAHNINLSAKAIVALGSYAMLCDMTGRKAKGKEVRKKADEMAKEWVKQATEGDHTRLAFDRSGTWSQKYNLVWDKLLGLNIFPKAVIQREISYYKTKQAEYGLPLDSRERYTKNDWITWTATMTDSKEDFMFFFDPVYDFANGTPQRVPVSDWYIVDNAYVRGFQARSVVGGFFIKMLDDPKTWEKWQKKGTNVSGTWAPLKIISTGKQFVPTSSQEPATWKYTFEKPGDNWYTVDFKDGEWKSGPAGFGSPGLSASRTHWTTSDIWIRRTVNLDQLPDKKLAILVKHDEDAEIYINGKFVTSVSGHTGIYETVLLDNKISEVLNKGINTIAVHCHQTYGGQFIDIGLAEY